MVGLAWILMHPKFELKVAIQTNVRYSTLKKQLIAIQSTHFFAGRLPGKAWFSDTVAYRKARAGLRHMVVAKTVPWTHWTCPPTGSLGSLQVAHLQLRNCEGVLPNEIVCGVLVILV